jgi:outer membrane protein TolC
MRIAVRGATLSLQVLVLFVMLPVPCRAQTRLTLEGAVAAALESRPLLKAESERIAAAEGRSRQAGALPNPDFQFSNENLRPGQTYSRDVDTLAFVTWPLDILGKRERRVAVARSAVTRSRAELDLLRRDVTQSVKRAYWAALGAQVRRELLQSEVATLQRMVDYHAAQLQAGTIAEQDLLRVRLEAERIQIAAHLATIESTNTRIDLLKEMGRPDLTNVTLAEPLDAVAASSGAAAVQEVLGRRVELKVAAASTEEARANSRLQDVSARPDLTVLFGYKRTQLPDALSGVNTALAGVNVTIPLLDRNQGNRTAAAAEVRRLEQLRTEAEAAVRSDLQRAEAEYEMRRAEVTDTLEPLREHARTISGIAQAAYQQGGVELLRLLDAERARLDAESAWVDGMVAFQQSVVNLERAQGVNR